MNISNMGVRRRVIRARVQLLLKNPFFGYLANYLELREHESEYPTGTDGICLYYFPEKIDRLEDEEIEGVFAHEVMHLLTTPAGRPLTVTWPPRSPILSACIGWPATSRPSRL